MQTLQVNQLSELLAHRRIPGEAKHREYDFDEADEGPEPSIEEVITFIDWIIILSLEKSLQLLNVNVLVFMFKNLFRNMNIL